MTFVEFLSLCSHKMEARKEVYFTFYFHFLAQQKVNTIKLSYNDHGYGEFVVLTN